MGRISRCWRIDFVILPSSGFVSNFDHEILVISPVCVTLFTSKDEVCDEAIPEGFKGGKIIAFKHPFGRIDKDKRPTRYLDKMTRSSKMLCPS